MRIKLKDNYKEHRKGETIEVSRNVGFHLIDSGIGIISKDMTNRDYKKK